MLSRIALAAVLILDVSGCNSYTDERLSFREMAPVGVDAPKTAKRGMPVAFSVMTTTPDSCWKPVDVKAIVNEQERTVTTIITFSVSSNIACATVFSELSLGASFTPASVGKYRIINGERNYAQVEVVE